MINKTTSVIKVFKTDVKWRPITRKVMVNTGMALIDRKVIINTTSVLEVFRIDVKWRSIARKVMEKTGMTSIDRKMIIKTTGYRMKSRKDYKNTNISLKEKKSSLTSRKMMLAIKKITRKTFLDSRNWRKLHGKASNCEWIFSISRGKHCNNSRRRASAWPGGFRRTTRDRQVRCTREF